MAKDPEYRRFKQEVSQLNTQVHRACKAIIVDADYTLWDHEHSVQAGIRAVRYHFPAFQMVPEVELVAEYKEIAAKLRARGGYWGSALGCPELHDELLVPFFARAKMPAPGPDVLSTFKRVYAQGYYHVGRARAGTLSILTRLRRRGYKIGTFHQGRMNHQYEKIERMGLWGAFDLILSAQEIHTAKPDVRVFELMAREMGVKLSETIVVGACLEVDVHAGLRAGVAGAVLYRPIGSKVPEFLSEFTLVDQHWVPVVNDLEQILDLYNIPRTESLAVSMTDSNAAERPPSPPRTPNPVSRPPRMEANGRARSLLHQQQTLGRTAALETPIARAPAGGPGISAARPLSAVDNYTEPGPSRPCAQTQSTSERARTSSPKPNSLAAMTSGNIAGAIEDEYQLVPRGTATRGSSSPPATREAQSSRWELLETIDLPFRQPAPSPGPSNRMDTMDATDAMRHSTNVGDERPTLWDRLQRSVGLGSSAQIRSQTKEDNSDDDVVMVE